MNLGETFGPWIFPIRRFMAKSEATLLISVVTPVQLQYTGRTVYYRKTVQHLPNIETKYTFTSLVSLKHQHISYY